MHQTAGESVTQQVFSDPIVELAAICPICALAALSPVAALAALSPALRIFNPAINPAAALLAFRMSNPAAMVQAHVTARVGTTLGRVVAKAQLRRLSR